MHKRSNTSVLQTISRCMTNNHQLVDSPYQSNKNNVFTSNDYQNKTMLKIILIHVVMVFMFLNKQDIYNYLSSISLPILLKIWTYSIKWPGSKITRPDNKIYNFLSSSDVINLNEFLHGAKIVNGNMSIKNSIHS